MVEGEVGEDEVVYGFKLVQMVSSANSCCSHSLYGTLHKLGQSAKASTHSCCNHTLMLRFGHGTHGKQRPRLLYVLKINITQGLTTKQKYYDYEYENY